MKGARIMTLDQVEGNEPIHENWGNPTGDDIDEVSCVYAFIILAYNLQTGRGSTTRLGSYP